MRIDLRRFGVALAASAVALAADRLLMPLPGGLLFLLPLGAVVLSGWYGGLVPGLLSTVCTIAGIPYLVLPPPHRLALEGREDVLSLALFALVAIGSSLLCDRLRRAERQARSLLEGERQGRGEAERSLRRLERELAERKSAEQRQKIHFSVTRILADSETLEEAAAAILEAVGEGLAWSFGAAWQVEPGLGALRCFAVWSASPGVAVAFEKASQRGLFAPGVGLPGLVWKSGTALWVRDVGAEPDFPRANAAEKDGLRAGCAFPVVRRGRTVGVFEFYSRTALGEDEALLESLKDLGRRVGQFTERRHVEQRLRILSEVSSVLGASLDYEAALSRVARLVAPALSDSFVVDLLEEDGSLRRLAPALDDPRRQRFQEVLRDEAHEAGGSDPVQAVLRSGKPELVPKLPDRLLRALAGSEDEFHDLMIQGPQMSLSVPLATRGKVVGVLSLATLDSSRHFGPEDVALAEELARRCAVAVDNARLFREAQIASEEKTRFLAAVSHDLRTPVNAIMLLSTLVRRQAESLGGSAGHEFVERCVKLESAARSFTELVTNLLDLSCLDAKEKEMKDEEFSLAGLLGETVSTLGGVARAKGLGLRCRPPRPDLLVRADRTELGRVLTNLVANALKFTPDGSVNVEAGLDGEGRVEIVVSDTGPGIAPDQLPKIFDEFFQIRNPERDRTRGSGLGLAIARRIMGEFGGELRAASAVGRGSVFTAVLPASRVIRPLPDADGLLTESGSRALGIASILVVDDDLVSAEALSELLREEGYRVSVAPSGQEALRRLQEERADLVLLDMMMPGLDGIEVIRRLRDRAGSVGQKIVAVTGDVTRDRFEAVIAAGADGFVRKPFQVGDLLSTIRAALVGEPARGDIATGASPHRQ